MKPLTKRMLLSLILLIVTTLSCNFAKQRDIPPTGKPPTGIPESTLTNSRESLPTPANPEILIQVDPAPSGEIIRPLLGVNVGPLPAGTDPNNANLTEAYQQLGVTLIRTHDFYGPLDMSTLYPGENADPASYNFAGSDRAYAAILAGEFEPYLRLGNSYNNSADPQNLANWVRAAVEVMRHYRQMSADAGIPLRYVEIWNEPDNRQFWDGDRLAFFDLFAQTALALGAEFPDLKVGGPGLTPAGFLTPQGQGYTQGFLDYMQSNDIFLDFFSWHIYSNDPNVFVQAAIFYREQLDSHGYTQAESHISEWNTALNEREGNSDPALRTGAKGAALMTAAWIGLQQQPVDVSTFYRGNDTSMDLPTFYGLFFADGRPKPVALAFSLWSQTGNLMFPWRPDYLHKNICADNPQSKMVFVDHVSIEWTILPGEGKPPDVLGDDQFERLQAWFDGALDYMEENRPEQVAVWGFVTHITEYAPGSQAEYPPIPGSLEALDRFLAYVDSKRTERRVIYATASEIADLAFP